MRTLFLTIFFISCTGFSYHVFAAGTAVNFSGNIFIPPCTVNGGKDVEVKWGSVNVLTVPQNNVGSSGAIQTVSIPMNCPFSAGTPSATWASSNSGAITGSLLTTNFNNSGVYIVAAYSGGTPVVFNSAQTVPKGAITGTAPNLNLGMLFGLARIDSASKAAGNFNATATLSFTYI